MTTTEPAKPAPELSVVVPVFNEADVIGVVVERTVEYLEGRGIDYELNLIDDGSRDSTAVVVGRACGANPRVRFFRHDCNRGYGAALRTGIRAARGRRILVSDGDGQFAIEDLGRLWERRDDADMVLGFRSPRQDPWFRRLAGWVWSRIVVRFALGGRYRDVNCGFKLIAREVTEGMSLASEGALVSAEILTRAARRGASYVEVGVTHTRRGQGKATGFLPRVVWRAFRELRRYRRVIVASSGVLEHATDLPATNDAIESPAPRQAKVAELADAQDSGSCGRKAVGVQVPPFAPPAAP